jgi:ectoine hydroxylase-related dioxygenase (phytanoyl-CoA dioxygenase family)
MGGMLTADQREAWERDGFFVVRGFAPPPLCKSMLERATELCREAGSPGLVDGRLLVPEPTADPAAALAEERVAKLFRLHRDVAPFDAFCRDERVLDLVGGLLGPELDCFLSQFIFKQPKAAGQPWHQDSYYFPFDRAPQVGIWLAVTDAALDNGPLWVLPGSQREPIHAHVPDARGRAYRHLGYVEIVDHDMSAARPALLDPGDLLVFHSHLMHRSTDNVSERWRAAMVYHYAQAGTRDFTRERMGRESPVNDWVPVRRTAAR